MMMSGEEVLKRLDELAQTKVGAPLPSWLEQPNNWGEQISLLAKDATSLIHHLQFTAFK
jgi:hypothetical protein